MRLGWAVWYGMGGPGVFPCFPDLICSESMECSITVMANTAMLMCLNTDVIFSKGQAENLGWELGVIRKLRVIISLFMPRAFCVCIFKQREY